MHASFKHPEFINYDTRRFCVRVMDAGRGTNAVSVYLSTLPKPNGSHWQAAREISMSCVAPGTFVSTNLLLVSDSADASVSSSELIPNINQRLYECELGGTVHASYTDSFGIGRHEDAAVGIDLKTVTLDVFVMTANGVAAVSDFTVQRDIADARERYAQADVKIEAGQVTQMEMPAGISTNWYVGFYVSQTKTWILSQDAKTILNSLPRTSGHIGMVYVHGPLFSDDITANYSTNRSGVVGTAVTSYGYPEAADAGYLGNGFISSTHSSTLFTLAHEGGHILDLSEHPKGEAWNLMHEFGSTSKDVKQSKRLKTGQIETMRGSPYLQ